MLRGPLRTAGSSSCAGERLIREGDPSEWFYVLLTGELRITKRIGGFRGAASTYKPGTFFGEPSILLDSPYVATRGP